MIKINYTAPGKPTVIKIKLKTNIHLDTIKGPKCISI